MPPDNVQGYTEYRDHASFTKSLQIRYACICPGIFNASRLSGPDIEQPIQAFKIYFGQTAVMKPVKNAGADPTGLLIYNPENRPLGPMMSVMFSTMVFKIESISVPV